MNNKSLLSWKINMVKQNPAKGVSVAVFILALSVFAGTTADNVLFVFISFIVLGIYVLPYYLPVTYTLTETSVIIKTGWMKKERNWSEFRRWEQSGNAVKLYTMKNRSRLDNYRAWLLRTGQRIDDVVTIVSEKIPS